MSLRTELRGVFYRETGKTATQNALTEAIDTLEMIAAEAEPVSTYLRVARPADGEIYVDLGDKADTVVRISADGWEVIDRDVPVLFRRTTITKHLPVPERGGDLSRLWEFVNLQPEDRGVIIGWLVAAYVSVGLPTPILALLGEQGTAKTSAMRRVLSLIDPTSAPVRRPPNDAEKLLHAAHGCRGLGFDNLSSIPRWLSDGLCRAVTGETDVDRSLYSDDDLRVIQVMNVLAFTGIDVGAIAGDLAERSVWGDLTVIPATERRSEQDLNSAWDAAYPSMVGGLFDLVAACLAKLPEVNLTSKPRMADFAEILAALDLATGSKSLARYTLAQDTVAEDIVATDQFLVTLASKITKRWEGTGKQLYELLPRPENDRYWPEPRGISGKLRRSAPDLRKAGWEVTEIKPDAASKRPKTWILVPPEVDTEISDKDMADLAVLQEMRDHNTEVLTERLLADGAVPDCVHSHMHNLREGFGSSCQTLAENCTLDAPATDYAALAARLNYLDGQLFAELSRLKLTSDDYQRLVAEGQTATS